MLSGGCWCGTVRYEAGGTPSHETNCHCNICRRVSGAPYVAWFSVPLAQFRYISGEPVRFESTPGCVRSFCGKCGTPLTFHSAQHAELIDVTIGSLDEPQRVAPRDHTWTRSKLPWVALDDGLPAYPRTRDDQPGNSGST